MTSFADFTVEPAAFAAALVHPDTGQPLEQDPQIAELAAVKSLYSAAVPLLDDEIPGDDNGRRLAYFYNSDLSPFYFAEKVSGEILDDQFSDSVMLAIAAGKAEAGLLAEAEAIVDTQIYQAQAQGDGYYSLAGALIGFGRFPEAIAALKKAEGRYRKVLETKGFASIGSGDAINLQRVGSGYRRAGDLAASRAVTDYLAGLVPYLTTPNEYGSIIVGTWQVADEYLAAGRSDLAAPLVDFMYDFALQTPPNVSGGTYYFKAKILYLVETAKRYAALDNPQMVAEIYQQIQAIRASDGYQNLTAGKTWSYMVDTIELLYRLGWTDEAYALAGEMPDAYVIKAFKLVATYEAVQNGMTSALAVIEAHIPLVADKIEALTYFANNTSREYIALALINRDLLDGARQALAEARRQMAYLTPATDADRYQQMIRQGYVKIAGLYALTGDPATAAALLREAETALAAMSGLTSRVEGLTDIALGYHGLGNDAYAGELLDRAGAEIAGMLAATAPPADPAAAGSFYLDVAKSYELLIDTCLDSGLRQQAMAYVDPYTAVIRLIFAPAAGYAGDDHDKFAGLETDQMLKAAGFLLTAGDPAGAAALLGEAEETAGRIWVEATRTREIN